MSNFQMSDFAIFVGCNKQRPSSIKHNQKKKKEEHKHKFKKRQTTILFHKQNYIFTNKDAGHQIKSKNPPKKSKKKKENTDWK